MPLIFAPTNTALTVVRVAADDKTKKRLESLGVTQGAEISVLTGGGGSIVCKIKEGRVALDGCLSAKIFVSL